MSLSNIYKCGEVRAECQDHMCLVFNVYMSNRKTGTIRSRKLKLPNGTITREWYYKPTGNDAGEAYTSFLACWDSLLG